MHRRTFIHTSAAAAGAALAGCAGVRMSGGESVEAATLNAATFNRTRRFTTTRFGRVAYNERGAGPAALFVHGFPLNGFQWRASLERLAQHRRCLAPDLLGMGYSEAPSEQDLSPQAQADMLVAYLDALGIASVDVVANDSGGTIAQLLMVQHPTRVRSMLLTNCDVHTNSPPAQMSNSIASARAGTYDVKIANHLSDRRYARSPRGIGGSAYSDPATFSDEAIEYYLSPLVSSPLRKLQLNRYLAAFEPNPLLAIEPALKRCQIPTRMVWGTADQLFPVEWASWLDRTIPASRGVRLVEGGKLFWPEEQPELLAVEAQTLWGVDRA